MPIDVTCQQCGKQLQAADEWAGRQAPCPQCQCPIQIPVLADVAPQKNLGDHVAMRMILPVGRSLWAIAAGYFGLFSFVIFPAPLALILALIAIWDIKTHPDRHGMGRAIFGLIMGILGTGLLTALLISGAFG